SFGSANRTKREFAAEIAATLAMSAAKNGDKVALLLFTDEVELFVPPRKGRRHILRLVREMLMFQPKKRATDISRALVFLNHVLNRRAIVFLLTDFLHSDAGRAGSPLPAAIVNNRTLVHGGAHGVTRPTRRDVVQELGLTNTRHDVVCLHLHDPRESELPDAGLVTIEDAETGELLELNSARNSVREKFAAVNAERLTELDRSLIRTGVDTLRLKTTEPFAPVLQRFFEIRRGRRRG
ncbi:MAG: VWA domain-containing protein, partial [Verrucomicrobiae bacterium]